MKIFGGGPKSLYYSLYKTKPPHHIPDRPQCFNYYLFCVCVCETCFSLVRSGVSVRSSSLGRVPCTNTDMGPRPQECVASSHLINGCTCGSNSTDQLQLFSLKVHSNIYFCLLCMYVLVLANNIHLYHVCLGGGYAGISASAPTTCTALHIQHQVLVGHQKLRLRQNHCNRNS